MKTCSFTLARFPTHALQRKVGRAAPEDGIINVHPTMKEIDFPELLDALAQLEGRLLSILVVGRSGDQPVAVLIGTAGPLDIAGEEGGDVSREVAFVPVEEESAVAMGRQGVYLPATDFESASRIAERLIVTMRELRLEIEPT